MAYLPNRISSQLKSGHRSAARLPQAALVNLPSGKQRNFDVGEFQIGTLSCRQEPALRDGARDPGAASGEGRDPPRAYWPLADNALLRCLLLRIKRHRLCQYLHGRTSGRSRQDQGRLQVRARVDQTRLLRA